MGGGIKPFIAQSVDAATLQQKETMLIVVNFLQNEIKKLPSIRDLQLKIWSKGALCYAGHQ